MTTQDPAFIAFQSDILKAAGFPRGSRVDTEDTGEKYAVILIKPKGALPEVWHRIIVFGHASVDDARVEALATVRREGGADTYQQALEHHSFKGVW